MAPIKIITGKRYGKLVVLDKYKRINNRTFWLCKCDCGKEKWLSSINLLQGNVRSCGCIKRGRKKQEKNIFQIELKSIYKGIKQRCFNKKSKSFYLYGGRGITICDEWGKDFNKFYEWSIKNGYKKGLSIDRINNNIGYCPENCRWATKTEQNRNKRNNHLITYNGETYCISKWAEKYSLSKGCLVGRIKKGWDIEYCLTKKMYSHKKTLDL